MKINKDVIAKMNPCNSRFENYINHYSDFNGTLEEFSALDKITVNDKIWVFVRLANKSQNVNFAIKCAKAVLGIFESKYPNDLRPRRAIEAAEAYLRNPSESNRNAAYAARTAAYAAADVAARATDAAARAAAHAAAYAATDVAARATDAAARAAAHAAAYAATDVATRAAAYAEMESKILQFMLEVL